MNACSLHTQQMFPSSGAVAVFSPASLAADVLGVFQTLHHDTPLHSRSKHGRRGRFQRRCSVSPLLLGPY